MGSKKILFLANSFPPQKTSGIQNVILNICRYLEDDVIIVAPKVQGYKDFDDKFKYQIYRIDLDRNNSLIWLFFDRLTAPMITTTAKGLIKIKKIVKREQIDLMICSHIYFSQIGYKIKINFGIPYVILGHALEITRPRIYLKGWRWKLYQKMLMNADLIVTPSEYTRQEVIKWEVPETKVVKSPWGVDVSRFKLSDNHKVGKLRREFSLNGKKVVLTVGRLIERKGHDKVIEALPLVIKRVPQVHYLIVGTGPYKEILKSQVNRLNLNNYLTFVGYADERDLRLYYQLCDLFIMPCRIVEGWDAEGFGLVFLEANACGKPVIGGRSGGVGDAIVNGETGLLVNPTDEKEIAEAVIKLLSDDHLARKMGQNGRKRVERIYNWENTARIILSVKRSVLEHR